MIGYIDEKENWVLCRIVGVSSKEIKMEGNLKFIPKENWGGIWGKAMKEKRPIYINKVKKLPEGHPDIFNALDVPIVFKDKLIGNIIIGNKKGRYTENDLKLLKEISIYLAPILNLYLSKLNEEKEKRELQNQLYQIQKMDAIGKLAGGIAHDFNNILSIIIGNCEILMKNINEENPLYANLKEIYNSAIGSTELTKKLLGFAKKQTIRLKVFDINEKIRESYDLLKRLIGENIKLENCI